MTTTPYLYQDKLESERLITRFLTLDDVNTWANFFRDEEAFQFLPLHGLTVPEEIATQWIERQLDRYATNRFGLQVLIDKQSGEFIGQCGLIEQEVDGIKEIEVGYHVFKKYWGKGYAPEAAKLFLNYAFTNNLTPSVISIIDIDNIKSQRVADKNGLQLDKITLYKELNVHIYRMRKEDWK